MATKKKEIDAVAEDMKAEKKTLKEIEKAAEQDTKDAEKAEKKKAAKEKSKFGKRVHVIPAETIHCRGTFIEDYLGSRPGSMQIFTDYVASNAPDAKTMKEEIELYGEEDVEDVKTTKLYRDKDGDFCIISYQLRGFLKSAAEAVKRAGILTVTAHKKVIHDTIKISGTPAYRPLQRYIKLRPPEKTREYLNQRPLRADTPQGERTALASSEALKAGTTFEFWMHLFTKQVEGAALSWFEYGAYSGLGQWRNAGFGRFLLEVEVDGQWIPLEEVEELPA